MQIGKFTMENAENLLLNIRKIYKRWILDHDGLNLKRFKVQKIIIFVNPAKDFDKNSQIR